MSGRGRPRVGPVPDPMAGFEFLDDDDFVTTDELASVLGVISETVRDWIRDGVLPGEMGPGRGYRSGGRQWRIRVGDARALIAARGDGSGSSGGQIS